jgi:hypothetical protein
MEEVAEVLPRAVLTGVDMALLVSGVADGCQSVEATLRRACSDGVCEEPAMMAFVKSCSSSSGRSSSGALADIAYPR